MKRLATICARGGSKGLADKNIRPLAGRPLIAHTIVQAREAGLFTCVAVSSDSDRILDCGKEWGAVAGFFRMTACTKPMHGAIPIPC